MGPYFKCPLFEIPPDPKGFAVFRGLHRYKMTIEEICEYILFNEQLIYVQ